MVAMVWPGACLCLSPMVWLGICLSLMVEFQVKILENLPYEVRDADEMVSRGVDGRVFHAKFLKTYAWCRIDWHHMENHADELMISCERVGSERKIQRNSTIPSRRTSRDDLLAARQHVSVKKALKTLPSVTAALMIHGIHEPPILQKHLIAPILS